MHMRCMASKNICWCRVDAIVSKKCLYVILLNISDSGFYQLPNVKHKSKTAIYKYNGDLMWLILVYLQPEGVLPKTILCNYIV